MNRYEQEQYNYVKSIAKSLERIAIALEGNKKSRLASKGLQLVKKANRVKHI